MKRSRSRRRAGPRPRALTLVLLACALLLGTASAQDASLDTLAPRDTILAVGFTPHELPDGDLHEAFAELDWEGARAAWEALAPALEAMDLDFPAELRGLPGLGAAARGPSGDAGGLLAEAEETCPGVASAASSLADDTWADEVLVTVSMDAFAAFPAGLAAVRLAPGATDAAGELLDRLVACFGTASAGSQSGTALHVIGDGSDLPLVVARHGTLLLAGTRPDVVRAAIRRETGASEASLATTRIGEAMASFGGGLRVALNTQVLADLLETRLPPMGGEVVRVARERGVAALRTFGGAALRIDVEDPGLVSESVIAFDRAGGDDRLAALLACDGCRASGPFLAPADAVAVSGMPWRPQAWVDYLDGWIMDLSAAAGERTDLRALASEWAGVDLDAALLSWVGDEAQTIRMEPFSPDLRHLVRQPPSAVVVPVTSDEAARDGIRAFARAVVQILERAEGTDADLPTADDLRALVSVRERSTGGFDYYRLRVGPTSEFAVGTIGNRLVIASPAEAFARLVAVERGEVRNGFASAGWRAVGEAGTNGRVAWSYGDGGADLVGLAELLDLAVQPLAFAASAILVESIEGGPGADGPDVDLMGEDAWSMDGGGGTHVDVAATAGYGDVDVSAVRPAVATVPSSVGGALGPDTPRVGDTPMDLYRIAGLSAGDTVTVDMTSDDLDTYLYLIDARGGRFLGEDDDSPDTRRSRIVLVADGETELTVGASSFGGFGEGAYELTFSPGAPEPAASFGRSTDVLDVATAERYGELDLPAAAPRSLRAPASVSGELSWDADEANRLNGALVDLYELTGLAAGDVVTVEMTSQPVDTYLYLVDADRGTLLAEVDDSPDTNRSALTFTADGSTRLWIGAGSWAGSNEGPYRLSVTAESSAASADEAPEAEEAEGAAADLPGEPAEGEADDGTGEAAEGTADEANEETGAPSFDELMTLFEIAPDVVALLGERLGTYVSVTESDGETLRTVHRQAFDW